MLTKIKIENLALLKEGEVSFDKGLNALTGETGAGKSVIVNAIALILGGRAEKEYIRHKAKLASIEAHFDLNIFPSLLEKYPEYIENNTLTIYREFSTEGASKTKINNKTVSLNLLKEITSPVAEILGQHAGQELMNESNHLFFLDRFASLETERESVKNAYHLWRETTDELKRIISKQEHLKNERELLLFQKDEIKKADIKIGEEESLNNKLKILSSTRNLMKSSTDIQEIISGEENSVLEMLSYARKELQKMAEVDNKLEKQLDCLTDLEYQLEDIRQFIEQYGSSLEDDPARMEEINLRLDEIYNLKKKYGGSEQSILNSYRIICEKLASRPDVTKLIEKLREDSQKQFDDYSKKALNLSQKREKAAGKLEKLVITELKDLAIDNGGFKFEFIREEDSQGVIVNGKTAKPLPHGLEDGKILFSANPGEPLKSLVKTASGGEISRVLLALKSAETSQQKHQKPVLVFDEVDAGIGGRTALEIGKKLKKLSEKCQLIVITHLHQIARLADHHFVAEKTGDSNRTLITVKKLDKKSIKTELDRMVALPED